jgi:hypothetical protein
MPLRLFRELQAGMCLRTRLPAPLFAQSRDGRRSQPRVVVIPDKLSPNPLTAGIGAVCTE